MKNKIIRKNLEFIEIRENLYRCVDDLDKFLLINKYSEPKELFFTTEFIKDMYEIIQSLNIGEKK